MLQTHTVAGSCKLAGNRVEYDRRFIAKYMPTLANWLSRQTLDVTDMMMAVEKHRKSVYQNRPQKRKAHRALEDIMESIEEYKYYVQQTGFLHPSDLINDANGCNDGYASEDTSCFDCFDCFDCFVVAVKCCVSSN